MVFSQDFPSQILYLEIMMIELGSCCMHATTVLWSLSANPSYAFLPLNGLYSDCRDLGLYRVLQVDSLLLCLLLDRDQSQVVSFNSTKLALD